jgi:propionate CoA-transferase
MAQVDGEGNVNVSKYGLKISGVGGFVNISQTAKRLVFCGTFTADGLEVEVREGKLKILQEGKIRKFVSRVEQVSFSASRAASKGQEVLYITERAVFRLRKEGLELVELAPGIDLEGRLLKLMEFRPIMGEIKPMPSTSFK